MVAGVFIVVVEFCMSSPRFGPPGSKTLRPSGVIAFKRAPEQKSDTGIVLTGQNWPTKNKTKGLQNHKGRRIVQNKSSTPALSLFSSPITQWDHLPQWVGGMAA